MSTPKVYIQIGTNDGDDLFYKKVVDEKPDIVILVEPNPIHIPSIKSRYLHMERDIIIRQQVVHPLDGQLVKLFVPQDNKHSSVIMRHGLGWREDEYITVPTISFNTMCKGLQHIDYLQIDTEGFDNEILDSIDFTQFTIDIIRFERWTDREVEQALSIKRLEGLGYTVEKILDWDGDDYIAQKISK